MSICQYVNIGIKMKVVQNVIRMSHRHYVNMSICLYVSMSIERFYRQLKSPLLFILNIIPFWENQYKIVKNIDKCWLNV